MKYLLQTTRKNNFLQPCENSWQLLNKDFAGHDNIKEAIASFIRHINLARVINPARVIDTDGNVYCVYDSEKDTRLPGRRWRIIQKNAYFLWENAGSPVGDGVDFWLQAEESLVEHNGVDYLIAAVV